MIIDETDLKLLFRALTFATNRHRHQRRKDSDASPYINHPISLANILCNEGQVTDIVTLCCALLHDTVEDTETTADELGSEFGETIRDVVLEVSDNKHLPKQQRKQAQIAHAPQLTHRAKLVKLADKISNLRDVIENPPTGWSLQRRQDYFDWALQVIDGVRGTHTGLEALFDEVYAQRPLL